MQNYIKILQKNHKRINFFIAGLFSLFIILMIETVDAGDTRRISLKSTTADQMRKINMNIGDSFVVNLPASAREVLVGDPEKISVIMRSTSLAYIVPKKLGKTDVLFFDSAGKQIAGITANISIDVSEIQETINKIVDKNTIKIDVIKNKILLRGSVANAVEAEHIVKIAASLIDGEDNVINALTIKDRTQVLLKVTIAEIQRNIVRSLGIDLSASFNLASRVLGVAANNAIAGAAGLAIDGSFGLGGGSDISASLKLLENNNLSRILAEPTLTAASGETAEFLAGGEYPIPISIDGQVSITYKSYGVELSFLPIVLSSGRISLKVSTSVSALSSLGAVNVGGTEIPSLISRRAETTVEIPSGGSLVIAGLINDTATQSIKGVPGIKDTPIIGALFSSRHFERAQSELVVIVTPYIVKPTAPNELTRPDQGYIPPDAADVFFLRIIKDVYGGGNKNSKSLTQSRFNGNYGFID